MTTVLFAQPYSIEVQGFYFCDGDEYDRKAATCKDRFGMPVEEFEIQFIDGELIDCDLSKAIGLSQANLKDFFDCVDAWEDWEKINSIIAFGELGYKFDPQNDPDHYGIDIYYISTMKELAEQFVEDGLYGDIPENLQFYIDYEAIASDLSVEYTQASIAGEQLIYRAT